ncbi:AAA family ATPase [Dysosmobacter sp.]|uniref:AAA family ATPase n=1 Tax=Dysosmobacter sp. TaxID=2591382 RepID=UPI003078254F
MRIFSMPELMDTHFPSRPCIIENLLPAGTYLLAGAPKIGKSFLVLQMAYQVSAGEPFLGFPSRQGTVLYLALEDTYERLQKRLAQMTERDSPDLVLSVLADTLEEDLLELMDTHFPSRPCIIENLLPAGTYLLAGAPKIGKSFLVLQMAYQVSAGEPFLGFPSRQGTVLYLALEDTYERLQKRLAQMTERDSPDLVLSVLADTLEEDLLEQLESFLFEYPETVLVIIDTLQRIRGRTPDNGSYAADYDTIAKLKAFSDQRGIALLLVHHTRKEGAEDVFDTISGTNGILGAADGALVLHKDKRTSGDAILDVVGRDQPQIRLRLRFDPTHSLWQVTEVETEPFREPPNPLLEFLSRLVNEENPLWSGTATELVQCLSEIDSTQAFSPNWIVRALNVRQDDLLRKYGIRYGSRRTKDGKVILLRWEGVR